MKMWDLAEGQHTWCTWNFIFKILILDAIAMYLLPAISLNLEIDKKANMHSTPEKDEKFPLTWKPHLFVLSSVTIKGCAAPRH